MLRLPKRGFTLLELLVAIAIVGMLIAMLLVSIGQARESARRMQCASNMRQIGLALHAYHEALGSLPPAVIWAPYGEPLGAGILPIGVLDRVALTGDPKQDRIYANWIVMILHQLGEGPIYNSLNLGLPISHASNSARSSRIPALICPSDPYSDSSFLRGMSAGLDDNEYGRGNYGINGGPDAACISGIKYGSDSCVGGFFVSGMPLQTNNRQAWGSGMAGINKSFRFQDVPDGMSNTVIVDEIRAGVDQMDPRGTWALGQIGSSVVARHGETDDACGPNPVHEGADEFIGCKALEQRVGSTQLEVACMECAEGTVSANLQAASRSLHPNGINLLFCDGSVTFATNQISRSIWHAIHTRDRNDVVIRPF